ncbi:MAG: lectin-like protein, partial [Phycisphaerales bacterium]|nr:lectin-like protein [Phycisphaerales bacterium]
MNYRESTLKTLLAPAALTAATVMATTAMADPVQWPASQGGNGHEYEVVLTPDGMNWSDARDAAEAAGGHLATVSDMDELDFINSLDFAGTSKGWIGGYQDMNASDYAEPDGGWKWVTGEPWSFVGWWEGGPSSSPTRNYVQLAYTKCQDEIDVDNEGEWYVIEFDPDALEITVDDDGPADFDKIQDAINAASNGTVIRIHPGYYQENLLINDGRSLTFESTDGPESTFLDGGQTDNVLYCSDGGTTTLKGLTIQNGQATALTGHGGGVCVDHGDLLLESCHVIGNRAKWGGGVYLQYGHLAVDNCLFEDNSVDIPSSSGEQGGAICTGAGNLTVYNSQFTNNRCGFDTGGGVGGAIACGFYGDNFLSVSNSIFTDNFAGEAGGGIETHGSGPAVTVDGCQFRNNVSSNGGAIRSYDAPFTCRDSLFLENEASIYTSSQTQDGGAICLQETGEVLVENCDFESNLGTSGGAFVLNTETTGNQLIKNCRFNDNVAVHDNPVSGGGALNLIGTGIVTLIDDCRFSENQCPINGKRGTVISLWEGHASYSN